MTGICLLLIVVSGVCPGEFLELWESIFWIFIVSAFCLFFERLCAALLIKHCYGALIGYLIVFWLSFIVV